MWKIILCRLGLQEQCEPEYPDALRLFEKTKLVLYRTNSLAHLNAAKKLIREYEALMQKHNYPLPLVTQHHELLKLWDIRFKRWKRG